MFKKLEKELQKMDSKYKIEILADFSLDDRMELERTVIVRNELGLIFILQSFILGKDEELSKVSLGDREIDFLKNMKL